MNQNTLYHEVYDLSVQLASKLDTAWNNRDVETFTSLFQSDADLQFYNGLMVRGKKLIKRFYSKSVFPNLHEGLRHLTKSIRIRLLTDTVAIVDAKVDLVDEAEDDDKKRVQRKLLTTTVIIKEDERWWISAVRIMTPTKD
jgi:uncharacterized protein (TIGR02246 family)